MRKGISLLVLIITITVIVILASTVIISLLSTNVMDQSKKATFMSDFRTIQGAVNLYSFSKYNKETNEFDLPLKGYLTEEDKTYIKENVPTLETKIEELSGSINTVDLAWIDHEMIDIKLPNKKQEKGYIIDVVNHQIYDYVGDIFESKKWHTLDGGINIDSGNSLSGYIKLKLFYPEGSTERQWRLGNPGELRLDPTLQWQYYTDLIYIPIYRTEDVWIKYVLNEKTITIPPSGTLLVDIVPDETTKKVDKVNITIDYDKNAISKEYRIGNSGWLPYNGPFVVTENTIIAARATKSEETKDSNGNIILIRDIYGSDKIYVGNIGIEETNLPAPTIERLAPLDSYEKARVRITYPIEASQKAYKINFGLEESYTEEVSIKEWDTSVLAYYYDLNMNRSKGAIIYINDTSDATPELPAVPYEPDNPYDPEHPESPYNPANPNSPLNPNNPNSPFHPESPYNPENPNSPLNPSNPNYGDGRYDPNNPNSPLNPNNPDNPYNPNNPNSPLNPNNPENPEYEPEGDKLIVNISANPDPLLNPNNVDRVVVSIDYDSRSIENTYKINNGQIQNYTGSFDIIENSTIYAYAKGNNDLEGSSIKVIDNLKLGISEPLISPNPSEDVMSSKIKINIKYDKNAIIKRYSINGGELKNYGGEFEITENGTVIYAYNENINGENADSTYTVVNVDPELPTQIEESPEERVTVLEKDKYFIMKLSYPQGTLTNEYKFTDTGVWTPYKKDGIMLVMSKYKDEVLANINNNGVLKIQDDNGNIIDFNGEWYVIYTSVDNLIESLFMRWDTQELSGPQIFPNTIIPSKQVTLTMVCPDGYKARKYKLVNPGDSIPEKWIDYTQPIIVDKNDSIIYGKYVNENGKESAETIFKVTNIDEIAPIINLTADLVTEKEELLVHVKVIDNMQVDIVKWAIGAQNESYFENNGIEILNDTSVTITENGTYTFFAQDTAENKQIYTLTVENIVEMLPIAVITMSPSTDIYTVTDITWSYSQSTDPKGQSIVATEWQLDNNAITNVPPNGPISTRGNHIMKLRVQNQSGKWSDWVQKSFNVIDTLVFDFNYTGDVQTWTVPSSVTRIKIECYGAQGGNGLNFLGSYGGYVKGEKIISGGIVLNIYVGGKGANYTPGNANSGASPGGWNGGGAGGSAGQLIATQFSGGAGGGASDVRIGGTALSNRIIVAGGGGGAAYSGSGGAGGGLTGSNGSDTTYGGKGGTQSSGGLKGTPYNGTAGPGANGVLGRGGAGGRITQQVYSGGGGGGGYYGGGGGTAAYGGGGGGGSSYYGSLL
ncbi:MAG: glycine rich domain-containing protein, partial [Tissierellia bacterium]|nr:glycine rich domain-containing protein [Tissierellia bacterium]